MGLNVLEVKYALEELARLLLNVLFLLTAMTIMHALMISVLAVYALILIMPTHATITTPALHLMYVMAQVHV